MTPEISWVFEVAVNPESLDEFKTQVARISVEDELPAALAGFSPRYMSTVAGYTRR